MYFNKVQLIVLHMNCAFDESKKFFTKYNSGRFSVTFSSTSFILFSFIPFQNGIHFELIFVNGIRSVSRILSFHVGIQLF